MPNSRRCYRLVNHCIIWALFSQEKCSLSVWTTTETAVLLQVCHLHSHSGRHLSVLVLMLPQSVSLQPQKARFYGWRGKSFCIPAAMPAVFTSSCYSTSFNCWQGKMFCFTRNSKSRQNVPPEKNCLLISFSRRSRKTAILL